MAKQSAEELEGLYQLFVADVAPAYQGYVNQTHETLLAAGCTYKIEQAKSGFMVSYSHMPAKRVLLNFVFRKSGLVMRIYGDHVGDYVDFMETLPQEMMKGVAKAPACKRMTDPLTCNQKCRMGYDFTVQGHRYQKCQYSCFMFAVDDTSIPFVKGILERELLARAG